MGSPSPVLVLVMLSMVLLGAIPRRYWYVQLPAVLGWVLVWADSQLTGHWTDVLGLVVTGLSLMWLWATRTPKRAERWDRYDHEP
ncbi:hypothetical protein C8D87_103679 [Lentzea atacamensis]|uniref:DUF2484 family protein n=1 Tax=Lentzea atacamensis TaxID=531938 RepID=A0ABX9EAY8_9PSEU|nr:hypothetical protein [Lentzea atacamensis]RAS67340.1 hypothetical protein C8D87_103679 [Lentzea atacamensis]